MSTGGRLIHFIDPFEKRKAAGRRPKPSSSGATARDRPRARPSASTSSSGSESGGLPLGWIAAATLLLLGGGYWWWSNQPAQSVQEPTRQVRPELKPGQGEKDRDAIRKQIEDDIGAAEPVEAPDDKEDEGFAVDEEPELIPIPPKDRGKGASSPGNPNALPSAGGGSAADDLADGEAAFQRRDYRTAASAFRRAVDKDPRNPRYNGRLGAALARAGDSAAAMAPLTTAANGGYSPALVYLGDLAQLQGDKAGAVGYYQSYIATDPPDARAIQVKLDRLLGG